MENNHPTEDGQYLVLERGIPYYKPEHIEVSVSNRTLFIDAPRELKTKLDTVGFETRGESNLDGIDHREHLEKAGIPTPSRRLRVAKQRVAEELLQETESGLTRFNGLMYGMEKCRAQRHGLEEQAGLAFEFYTTDFFTWRVFAEIYSGLLREGKRIEVRSLTDLNKNRIFLNSFGLAAFLIVNRGNGEEIILGHRSNEVIVDKGKLHFTMNEALSLLDKNEYGAVDFMACVKRGLQEELGIGQRQRDHLGDVIFLDFGMDSSRFEPGISCLIRYRFSEEHTWSDFLRNYEENAKDRRLESTGLETIKLKEIDRFLEERSDEISSGARSALRAIATRAKNGHLKPL